MKNWRVHLICIYSIIFVLGLSAASASWYDATGILKMGEGGHATIGPFSLKVEFVDDYEQAAMIEMREKGILVYHDSLKPGRPLVIQNKLHLALEGFSSSYQGSYALLRGMLWVDGRFKSVNFPKKMNYLEEMRYDTSVTVENTGIVDAIFRVEFDEGNFYRHFLEAYRPIVEREVPLGESTEYPFTIDPQSTGPAVAYPRFLLFGPDGELLDKLELGAVEISRGLSGFITANVPDTMVRDHSYPLTLRVRVNEEVGKLQDFAISFDNDAWFVQPENTILTKLNGFVDREFGVVVRPMESGMQDMIISLSLLGETIEVFSKPVKVLGGSSTSVSIEVPDEVPLGPRFDASVVVRNNGPERNVNLIITAPPLLEIPENRLLNLKPGDVRRIPLSLDAMVPGTVYIQARLETTNPNTRRVWTDDGYLISERIAPVRIMSPEMYAERAKSGAVLPPESLPESELMPKPDLVSDTEPIQESVGLTPTLMEKEEIAAETETGPKEFMVTKEQLLPFIIGLAVIITGLLGWMILQDRK